LIKWDNVNESPNNQDFESHLSEENKKRKREVVSNERNQKKIRSELSIQPPMNENFIQETVPSPSNASNYVSGSLIYCPSSPPTFNQCESSNTNIGMNQPALSPSSLSDKESDDSEEDEYDYLYSKNENENESEEIHHLATVSVDYMGMKASFIHSETFRNLLDRALEYWEVSELTNPREWILTNEKDAIWPLDDFVYIYGPEVVYLKKKPSRF